MPSNAEVRRAVEDAVESEIQRFDYDQKMSYKAYWDVLQQVADSVFERMLEEMRPELGGSDRVYIKSNVERLVLEALDRSVKCRFQKFERVVCKIGGERRWAHRVCGVARL